MYVSTHCKWTSIRSYCAHFYVHRKGIHDEVLDVDLTELNNNTFDTMKATKRIIYETIRMNQAAIFSRAVMTDDVIIDGHNIPKGIMCGWCAGQHCAYLVQHTGRTHVLHAIAHLISIRCYFFFEHH